MSTSLIKNTFWVYTQKFLTALITLASTPILLKNLGVESYGIYTLTIGLVAVFNFISWSLTAATQRFIAVSIAKDNNKELIRVFNNSLFIHLIYAVFLLLVILTVGVFFTDSILSIPAERLNATKYVISFVSLITFFKILIVPYEGLLKAYENFKIISILGIVDSIFKLTAASLLFYAPIDKLVFFSVLMFISNVIIFLSYLILVSKQYPIIILKFSFLSRNIMSSLFSFISWNILGALALLGRNQGIGIILNIFFGVIANAAYGIALQVQAALGIFSQGIITSFTPRILKSAGTNKEQKALLYSYSAAKYGILIIAIVGLPVYLNLTFLLEWWLKVIPENTIMYTRLIIIFILCTGFSVGLQSFFHGINRVKAYNLIVSSIIILNIPLSYFLFTYNFPSYSIFVVCILLEISSFLVRLFLVKRYIKFSVIEYLKNFTKEVVIPICLSFGLSLIMMKYVFNDLLIIYKYFFIINGLIAVLLFITISYKLSLSFNEKYILKNKLREITLKLKEIKTRD